MEINEILDSIRNRWMNTSSIDFSLTNPNQQKIDDEFSIVYAQGPNYPCYSQADVERQWEQVVRDQECIKHMHLDIYRMFEIIDLLTPASPETTDAARSALAATENAITRDVDALIDELRYFVAFPHMDHTARLRKAIDMLTRLKVFIR